MKVWWNGEIVDQEDALVSVFDRGFLYGDACFETLRVYDGKPAFWDKHATRLSQSLAALSIPRRSSSAELRDAATALVASGDLQNAVLRIQITRGRGVRGYSTQGCDDPTEMISLHPLPARAQGERPAWRLKTSSLRIDPGSPLHGHKSSNKLFQILATQEAEQAGRDDVLLLTSDGHVAETSCANVFWFDGATVCTPPLSAGVLPGVTRSVVIDLCRALGWECEERLIDKRVLLEQRGVFLTQSVCEIIVVSELDGHQLNLAEEIDKLASAYRSLAKASET